MTEAQKDREIFDLFTTITPRATT